MTDTPKTYTEIKDWTPEDQQRLDEALGPAASRPGGALFVMQTNPHPDTWVQRLFRAAKDTPSWNT